MDRSHIQKGAYLTSDGGPVMELSRPDPVRYGDPPKDPAAEFDAHVKRANELLDGIAAIKRANELADHADFIDLTWRLG